MMLYGKLMNMKNKKVLWIVAMLIIWQGISISGIAPIQILPSPCMVLDALYTSILKSEIISETAYSLFIIIEGIIIGAILSFILILAAKSCSFLDGFIETLIAVAHPLPGIALLPIIILWLGTGRGAILFIIVHSFLWPMILNIRAGFNSTPAIFISVGQNLGIKDFGLIYSIYIPASMPFIISGLRIGWARAWRALISAEMIFGAVGGKGGLGFYIFKERVFMDTPGMFAALIVIIIIGILVEDFVFERLESNTIKKWGMTVK